MTDNLWVFLGLLAVAFAIWGHGRRMVAEFRADPLLYEPPRRHDGEGN